MLAHCQADERKKWPQCSLSVKQMRRMASMLVQCQADENNWHQCSLCVKLTRTMPLRLAHFSADDNNGLIRAETDIICAFHDTQWDTRRRQTWLEWHEKNGARASVCSLNTTTWASTRIRELNGLHIDYPARNSLEIGAAAAHRYLHLAEQDRNSNATRQSQEFERKGWSQNERG